MADADEVSQIEVAKQAADAAEALAESTRTVQRPIDSHALLESITMAQDALAQVYTQLALWHGQVLYGVHHDGENLRGNLDNPGWAQAERELQDAARHALLAVAALKRAHRANGVVRWFAETLDPDEMR